MPAVLTKADTLACTYQGTVAPGSSKLRVNNNPVLTQATVENQSVAGCKASASQQTPCTSVKAVTVGAAKKLLVGNSPALFTGMTAGTDATHVIGPASAGQTKLVAS